MERDIYLLSKTCSHARWLSLRTVFFLKSISVCVAYEAISAVGHKHSVKSYQTVKVSQCQRPNV